MDISKFFDNVEHDWLIRFMQYHATDKRIVSFLKQYRAELIAVLP
ncbi:hypothetical protein [Photorhabdus sp. RM323S]